ncbi:host cell factor 1-like [Paramacrobiotus metropolitanus]|uniref:host cell factor 1-like n=1 Tax=Paramacrobiotus metropolitanus TaxID=2943436 RepID=UPI002445B645|nr:host cell factor 1-like [Paramacrobiotus metropolitanus]
MAAECPYKWRHCKIPETGQNGQTSVPHPRHGHRAVQIKELIIVFGGGNEGIVDELHVFNTTQNAWFVPQCKGQTPPGCAAFGFAVENTRLLVHGGMIEFGKYSGDLYELQATKWEWRKLTPKPPRNGPPPCPRLGHSFTIVGKKIYMFGGLCNNSPDPRSHTARYLNDLYVLDISKSPHQWELPETNGTPPTARESHTAVLWKKNEGTAEQKEYLVLYGGMCGQRLSDIWFLDLETLTWQKPVTTGVAPYARSLHTAVVGSNKMYVFGGWIPREKEREIPTDEDGLTPLQREWKCTNSLGVFDFEQNRWDQYSFGEKTEFPRARAGHCAAIVHNRMYIWSGRDGYKKVDNKQVCCDDMWFLETTKPVAPGKVQLLRASTTQLDVHWTASVTGRSRLELAENYHLQIQVYESPPSLSQQGPNPSGFLTTASTAAKPQLITQGKNLPSGAQFVTLMKPGSTQGITLTPGSAVPVSGMVKLVPQPAATNAASKPQAIIFNAQKQTPAKSPMVVVPTSTASPATPTTNAKPVSATTEPEPADKTDAGTGENSTEANGNGKDAGAKEPASDGSGSTSSQEKDSTASTTAATEAAKPAEPKSKEDGQVTKLWYTVAITADPTFVVQNYYVPVNEEDFKNDYNAAVLSNPKDMVKHPLLPGTAYKFRVAGINACGRGVWSEMSAFKTCLPGFPGAPSNIKITKCPEGALLTWEPPTNHGDNINEYAVYLATKPQNAKPDVPIPTNQLSFMKVYDDPVPTCTITHENLRYAYYDCSGQKPAIIFRIAAKNDKGYGPATQVRWLQDSLPQSAR